MCRPRSIGNIWMLTVFATLVICLAPAVYGQTLPPGEVMQYEKLAFYPERWKDNHVSTELIPWEGKEVVFLTTTTQFDQAVMARFVGRLDAAWKLYANLTGARPERFRQFHGKPTIAAVPDASLTCGYGCGYIGASGIEVAGFYDSDYPLAKRDAAAFSHYLFYEMGRNYYTFGDRHSVFITGYAVFMRYVCMDALKCTDPDSQTRKTIEDCETVYAASDVPFLTAFTNLGEGEKGHRLVDAHGNAVQPSDQPVMYATAMLKLRKENGGDEWVKRFFGHLAHCPPSTGDSQSGVIAQCLNWLVASSAAARKDLSPLFADRWRMPLSAGQRTAMGQIDWNDSRLDVGKVVARLTAANSTQQGSE